MVELQPSKLTTRVRFPSPAPFKNFSPERDFFYFCKFLMYIGIINVGVIGMRISKNRIIIISTIVITLIVSFLLIYFIYVVPSNKDKERERILKEYYDQRIAFYHNQNTLYQPGDIDVVFIGDSLTDGCNLSKYYPEYTSLNRGISGDTTFTLENRLKVSVYDVKPKVVVMLIGGNNLKNMFDNYEDIVKDIKENLPDSELVLVSLTAMGKTFKDKNKLVIKNNAKISKISQEYNCHFVDVFTSLYDINTKEIFSEYTNDGAHLTDEGYVILTNKIKESLSLILKD